MSGFSRSEKNVVDGNGSLTINPFGSLETAELTATSQASFVYGINPIQWVTTSTGTDSFVVESNGIVTCSSGITPGGQASARILRNYKHRAGQGGIVRMSALFPTGVVGGIQLAGLGNVDSGYFFGRQDENFGILHISSAAREIRKLTITKFAAAGNITITLNGQSKTFSMVSGSSIQHMAYQISTQDYSKTGIGWHAEAIDDSVYFSSLFPTPLNESYSMTSAFGGSGSFSRLQEGIISDSTFISQSQWNIDKMDGSGLSKMLLDPTKGNVYEIGCKYLGFGNAIFSIEDPEKNSFSECHMIKSSNSRNTRVLKNPQLFAIYVAANSGSILPVTVNGASAAAFNEGKIVKNIGPSYTTSSFRTGIAAIEIPIITIRSNSIFNDKTCYSEVELFNISAGNNTSQTSRLVKISLYKNVTLTGPTNFQQVDATKSIVAADILSTGFTTNQGSSLVTSFIIAANASVSLSTFNENYFIASGETLTVTADMLQGTGDIAVTLSWFEDQ